MTSSTGSSRSRWTAMSPPAIVGRIAAHPRQPPGGLGRLMGAGRPGGLRSTAQSRHAPPATPVPAGPGEAVLGHDTGRCPTGQLRTHPPNLIWVVLAKECRYGA